jgi:DNA repair protein RecN (Recombination protein N)
MADRHFRVHKAVRQGDDGAERTVVHVATLVLAESRREELAQLAGGRTDREALDFASALLAEAERRRGVLVDCAGARE